jgi:hypothetical protein
MDLKETGCEDVGWNHLAKDKDYWPFVVNIVMNFRVP